MTFRYPFTAFDPFDVTGLAMAVYSMRGRAVERQCVAAVENYLGRVPNNAEIAAFARREVHPDKEHFFWKDNWILTIEYHGNGLGFYATRYSD